MRQRLNVILIGLALWLPCAVPAAADDRPLLETLSEQLKRSPVVRSRVTQTKTLAVLSRPLVAKGRVLFVRGTGLCWILTEPFPVTTVMTEKRITQTSDGETTVMRVDDNPILASLTYAFLPLFTGDLEALGTHFRIHAEGTPARWRLTLIPRDAPLNRLLTRLEMQGDRDLRTLTLIDPGGDRTHWAFDDVRRTPATLSPEEQAYFTD